MTYTEAYDELQQIVAEMEDGDITVDVLSAKVKRAAELLAICQKQLQQTELDVQQILADLDQTNPAK